MQDPASLKLLFQVLQEQAAKEGERADRMEALFLEERQRVMDEEQRVLEERDKADSKVQSEKNEKEKQEKLYEVRRLYIIQVLLGTTSTPPWEAMFGYEANCHCALVTIWAIFYEYSSKTRRDHT